MNYQFKLLIDCADEYNRRADDGYVLENFPYQDADDAYRKGTQILQPENHDRQSLCIEAGRQYPQMLDNDVTLRAYLELKYPPTFAYDYDVETVNLLFPIYQTGNYLSCTLPTKCARAMIENQIEHTYGRMVNQFYPNDLMTANSFDENMLLDAQDANLRLKQVFENITQFEIYDPVMQSYQEDMQRISALVPSNHAAAIAILSRVGQPESERGLKEKLVDLQHATAFLKYDFQMQKLNLRN